ncbi:hypothetical protein SAMN04487950_2166 [Halogranum rubrum]|uniref:Uncharacterized protein n=1 Tax=Halogranum rubrum TaxID=553466 RepID=A0A1I4EGD9_9EURY|nr:hypothetical protein [Halogranum rubrum]SFL04835.1 hypothetical protein SAMN04487950_2166 [Halogranum rubrum]
MGDPTTVKRALRALAYETHQRPAAATHRRYIEYATDSLRFVGDAAEFCEKVGVDRLCEAVRTADDRGEERLARRGQQALDTLRRYRRAADGNEDDEDDTHDDHIHSARGTPLMRAGQRGDR